jgi:hypothetical protein
LGYLAETFAAKVYFQHLFLLTYHIKVVEDPLVGAAYKALRFGFLNEQ